MGVQMASILFLQDCAGIIARIWSYLTQQFTFGRITVSASSLFVGVLVVVVTVLAARWTSTLIERRMASRRHIDPGLRYTICRLVRYVVTTVGFLVALKQAFAIDLTSIAVIFTVLSVGIAFGLQYIASDIAAVSGTFDPDSISDPGVSSEGYSSRARAQSSTGRRSFSRR
jgi:small-conductance mechanosensitive channel